jgi:hypothetical protein
MKMSIPQQLAAYVAQIKLASEEKEMNVEKTTLQNIYQQLLAIFWKLKFLIDQQCLEKEFKKDLVTKFNEFKQQKQIQLIYDIQSSLKNKCTNLVYQSGKELDIIITGAKLLGIDFPKIQWVEKIKSIEDEQTYREVNELYNAIIKWKSELIDSIDQKLKLKNARELLLKVLKEGEVKLSEFNIKQLEEVIKSPLYRYLSIKLSGK